MQWGLWLALLIFVLAGCQKQRFEATPEGAAPPPGKDVLSIIDSLQMANFFIKNRPNPDVPVAGQAITSPNNPLNNTELEYTDETFMQLGPQLVNPYSIENMTAVYNAYYAINLSTVPATHKYVRFNPTNEAQIALLDDSLELDLYTHPLDYQLLQDGDVYVPPGGNIEDMPVLYTVVPNSYTLPAGIPAVVLAPLHLPDGLDELMLSEMAESIALGALYSGVAVNTQTATISRTDVTGANGEHPTYTHHNRPCAPTEIIGIDEDPCPDPGGGFPPNPPPPPPPVCGLPGLSCQQGGYPRGRIRVWDIQLNQCVPVHDVQVRAKRWVKICNQHTNAQGEFSIGTRYVNPVQISVIFRNGELSVKPLRNFRGIKLSLLPVEARLGTYAHCELNTIEKIFYRTSGGQPNESLFAQDTNDKWRFTRVFRNWLAATAVVARKNQLMQAAADGVGAMKARSLGGHRLQLYLNDGGDMSARGCMVSMPMLAYINKGITWQDAIDLGKFAYYAFKAYKSISTGTVTPAIFNDVITALQTLGKLVFQGSLPDGILMYNTRNRNLSSSEVHEKFYEIYTNAGLLKNRVNKNDWKNYLKKESNKAIVRNTNPTLWSIVRNALNSNNDRWYATVANAAGFISASASLVNANIALNNTADGELFEMYNGFSEAYAHTLANRRYGTQADDLYDQNFVEIKGTGVEGSHSIYIETWKSKEVVAVESTVPKSGLFYDLFDGREDLVNNNTFWIDRPIISWNIVSSTGLGNSGGNTSPQFFNDWRNNLQNAVAPQSASIQQLFSYYQ